MRNVLFTILRVLALPAFALSTAALAQGGAVHTDPASRMYQGSPGQTIQGEVRITNPGPTPIAVSLYMTDWGLNTVGDVIYSDPGTEPRSLSEWISLAEPRMRLNGHETRVLRYTVNVPADTEPGTHWGVLFAESEPVAPAPGQASASISVRVGHVIYVSVPELNSDGAVVGLFGSPPSEAGRPYTVIAHYANTGNAVQTVTGVFTLRNDVGEVVIESQMERFVVLPGMDRAFMIDIYGPMNSGNYTALVVLNFGDAERDVAGALDFFLAGDLTAPAGSQE